MFKKIASNTLSQIAGKWCTALISLFMIGALTKYFPPEWYWEYNKIYNYLWIFAFLADLWLYTLTIREISKNQHKAAFIIGNVMSLRLILWILVCILALWVAFLLPWYSTPATLMGIGIVGIFTVFNLLNSSVMSLMQAFMKIEFSMISTVLTRLIHVFFIVLLLFFLFPSISIVSYEIPFLWILVSGTFAAGLNFLLNWWYASRIVKVGFLWDWKYMKKMAIESLPYGMALFLSVVYFKVDVILLSVLEPTQIANYSIAMYSLPMKIVEVIMVLWVFYMNSLLPLLSEYFHDDLKEPAKKLIEKSFLILGAWGIFFFVMGSIFQDHILLLLATSEYISNAEWYASGDIFWIVLGVVVFYFLSSLYQYILIAAKKDTLLLRVNIVIMLLNIIGNFIFIPLYSFVGAWYVTLATQFLLFIILLILSRKIVGFVFDWKKIFLIGMVWIGIYFFWFFWLEILNLSILWEFLIGGFLLSTLLIGLFYAILKK